MLKKLFDNHFLRGSIIFTSVSFFVSLFSYFFNLLVARGVNLSTYGEYMTAVSYTTLLSVPFTAFSAIVIRKIGQAQVEHRSAYARGVERWIIQKLRKFSFLLILGASTLAGVLIWKANLELITVIYVLFFTAVSLFVLLDTAILQSYKSFVDAGKFLFVGAVLKLLAGVIVIIFFPHLLVLYLGIILSQVLSLGYGQYLLQKHDRHHQLKEKIHVEFQSIKVYLKRKSILIPVLTTLGLIALANADIILVKKFFSSDEVGLYAGLALLSRVILYVAQPISVVAYAFFTGSDSHHTSPKVLFFSALSILGVGLSSIGMYFFFPQFVIHLIFGPRFYLLSSILWLAAVFGSLNSFVTLLAQYWIARGRYLGIVSLLGASLQAVGILLFHASFIQVMSVNIIVGAGTLMVYLLPLLWQI